LASGGPSAGLYKASIPAYFAANREVHVNNLARLEYCLLDFLNGCYKRLTFATGARFMVQRA
jgi:hypothetical protein